MQQVTFLTIKAPGNLLSSHNGPQRACATFSTINFQDTISYWLSTFND